MNQNLRKTDARGVFGSGVVFKTIKSEDVLPTVNTADAEECQAFNNKPADFSN